ncbi:XRE family transcriptional regulator [Paenibacillus terreus]|uniref:XRE family transcriptional regulator n=1 Tax=Paenibacillus terreus TaxID=1387834 RepID=A0ABV5B0T3_9BACL
MNKKKPITPFGWAIKQRLTELQMDQKSFCELHGIPPSRLSNLIHGTRKAARYRQLVAKLLDIHLTEEK